MSILTSVVIMFIMLALTLSLIGAFIDRAFDKAAVLTVIILCIAGLCYSTYFDKAEDVSKGKYYATQCQLIETNINNGLFQPNTNKLKCGDVIENVSVDEYQEAIKAYKESQREK
ncbi:TPA: hypothetical protein U2M34_002205 [Providencia rettgeri]|uniref:hypothetical protein n=1 Tax=Providencia TaxID=586 RepID=UPI0024AB67F0|nr:hypothetical protein [Providencia rettgeri]